MKKVLIVYFSKTGTIEQIAQYIAEGVRIAGHEAEMKKVSDIKTRADIAGYDGYIFGCPTYHLDIPEAFKAFLSTAENADLQGKAGGAFSARTHPSSGTNKTAAMIYDTMESRLKMRMTSLGGFDLDPGLFDTMERFVDTIENIRTCQDYGKSIGEML
jgi:flavodoxin